LGKVPFMKVCVIGLGKVGEAVASYIHSMGLEVVGYDISSVAVEKAKALSIFATTDWGETPSCDVYLVCMYVGFDDGIVDYAPLYGVCKMIRDKALPRLVSIECTVQPSTCRTIFNNIFDKKIPTVHVPHRFWEKEPVQHGVNQLRVMGGADAKSLEVGFKFYRDMLNIPLHAVSSIEVAEMSKIAENAYRYIQIAFAEELKMVCEELGLDFNDVRGACNTKWNIKILEALTGVGGECLRKDTRFFDMLTDSVMLAETAMKVDAKYRKCLER